MPILSRAEIAECSRRLGLHRAMVITGRTDAQGMAQSNAIPFWAWKPFDDSPAEQVERVRRAYAAAEQLRDKSLRYARFLPFDQIDEDPARIELDRVMLVKVLGFPEWYCAFGGPMDILRRRLAREPQIHGGKKSRVVFDDDGGEHSEKRTDR